MYPGADPLAAWYASKYHYFGIRPLGV
uniref:Uncharacterized protein n=1 Tax=Anguilla anguilla TaxID=7936 RepID=A0A0E9VR47_ANGAN